MYTLMALAPILTVFFFLVILRWPAKKAMPLALVVATILAFFVWQVSARSSPLPLSKAWPLPSPSYGSSSARSSCSTP